LKARPASSKQTPKASQDGEPAVSAHFRPHGRFYGWTIVGVAFVAALTEVSFFNPVLGVFVRPLSDEFGWNRLTISLAISIGNVFGALVSPLAGAVLDRRGARLPMAFGATVMGGSLLALAFTQTLWWFYLFYFLGRGTAIGVVDMEIAVAVSNWFIQKRGLAMASRPGNRISMALPLGYSLTAVGGQGWLGRPGVFVLSVAAVPAALCDAA
jgi:MFS family permease